MTNRGVWFWATLIVLLVACLATPLPAADWAQFRGPAGLGVSADGEVPTRWSASENIVWKVDLPGPGTSSPVVVGNRIFLTCSSTDAEDPKRQLLCLDRKTGKTEWTKDIESKLPEQSRIRENHGFASSTPAVDAERIYAFFGKSGVLAFDHSGRQLWQADVGSGLNGWGSATSPLLVGDLVIVNASVESGSLVALDRKSGEEVWRAGGIRESWNTPILVEAEGKTELVVAIMGKVLGFDPQTGKQLWSCATDIGWYMVPSIVAHEGIVYCIGGRGGGGSLAVRIGGRGDVTRTHRLWKIAKGSNVPSPIYHDGHLYWANDVSGVVYCADAKTGEIVYEKRLERADQIYASPVLAGGNLYYTSRSGRTWVIAAQPEFRQVAVNDLRDRSEFNASPAVADGRLFLRSGKSLFCIGEK
jgi:outer membrane protein assembly factor BamB